MVMSLSGPCVSEGSSAERDVLEEVVSGCWGSTDWRHLRETARVQMLCKCISQILNRFLYKHGQSYIKGVQCFTYSAH